MRSLILSSLLFIYFTLIKSLVANDVTFLYYDLVDIDDKQKLYICFNVASSTRTEIKSATLTSVLDTDKNQMNFPGEAVIDKNECFTFDRPTQNEKIKFMVHIITDDDQIHQGSKTFTLEDIDPYSTTAVQVTLVNGNEKWLKLYSAIVTPEHFYSSDDYTITVPCKSSTEHTCYTKSTALAQDQSIHVCIEKEEMLRCDTTSEVFVQDSSCEDQFVEYIEYNHDKKSLRGKSKTENEKIDLIIHTTIQCEDIENEDCFEHFQDGSSKIIVIGQESNCLKVDLDVAEMRFTNLEGDQTLEIDFSKIKNINEYFLTATSTRDMTTDIRVDCSLIQNIDTCRSYIYEKIQTSIAITFERFIDDGNGGRTPSVTRSSQTAPKLIDYNHIINQDKLLPTNTSSSNHVNISKSDVDLLNIELVRQIDNFKTIACFTDFETIKDSDVSLTVAIESNMQLNIAAVTIDQRCVTLDSEDKAILKGDFNFRVFGDNVQQFVRFPVDFENDVSSISASTVNYDHRLLKVELETILNNTEFVIYSINGATHQPLDECIFPQKVPECKRCYAITVDKNPNDYCLATLIKDTTSLICGNSISPVEFESAEIISHSDLHMKEPYTIRTTTVNALLDSILYSEGMDVSPPIIHKICNANTCDLESDPLLLNKFQILAIGDGMDAGMFYPMALYSEFISEEILEVSMTIVDFEDIVEKGFFLSTLFIDDDEFETDSVDCGAIDEGLECYNFFLGVPTAQSYRTTISPKNKTKTTISTIPVPIQKLKLNRKM